MSNEENNNCAVEFTEEDKTNLRQFYYAKGFSPDLASTLINIQEQFRILNDKYDTLIYNRKNDKFKRFYSKERLDEDTLLRIAQSFSPVFAMDNFFKHCSESQKKDMILSILDFLFDNKYATRSSILAYLSKRTDRDIYNG